MEDWIERQRPTPPESLRRRLTEAVAARTARADDPAEGLARAALAELDAAGSAPETDRTAAWSLLTADALMTYACAAAAQRGPAAVAALAERYGLLLAGAGDPVD